MIELPIGTRFYYNGVLCEVSECMHCMATCVFNIANYEVCRMFACEKSKRKDGVGVFFERVKESADGERVNGHRTDDYELKALKSKL